ncbi:MAG: hypothetical protein M3O15_04135 [Acidobacteriota bacterium]|nr:hypothetical protein [Acidobacteriota bacterium]
MNRNGARYLIVGAHAVAFHARPRATRDLDLLIEPTRENGERVLSAIREFLGTELGLNCEDLRTPGRIVQLGVAPSRIDLLARFREWRISPPHGSGGSTLFSAAYRPTTCLSPI